MNKLDAENEEAWLAQRWELVTGSAAAVLMGLSPFKSREALLAEYITMESSFEPNRKAWFGLQLETAIGRLTARALGVAFSPCNELRWEDGCPVGSTMDGYLGPTRRPLFPPDVCPSGHKKNWAAFREEAQEYIKSRNFWVEIKNVGHDKLKYWNSPGLPPQYYWAQCQTQMLVTGEDAMALVAMVGGQDIRGHIIKKDQTFLDNLVEEATTFMQEVREGREL